MATAKSTKKISQKYESNPFLLTFNSFSNLFKTNIGWAITLVGLGAFGFMVEAISDAVRLATTESTRTHTTTTVASSSVSTSDVNVLAVIMVILGALILLSLFVLACVAIGTFINGMLTYVALESEKGKTVTFAEAIDAAAKRFWRLFLAQLLAGLKIFGWTLLFIIPGIFAAFRYMLLPYVVMSGKEAEHGVRSSHTEVKALVKGRLIEVFGVAVAAGIIPIVGPVMRLTGGASLYQQLKAFEGKHKPKPHWLNYLGFMLIGLAIILALFVAMIVGLAVLANK